MVSAIHQTVQYLTTSSGTMPDPAKVVDELLQAEKAARQQRIRHSYTQLIGTWQLGFITGTKRSRQHAGVLLGAGRVIPSWMTIQITYQSSDEFPNYGSVENSVKMGPFRLALIGSTRFWQGTNILSFDFGHMTVSLSQFTLYNGTMPGGKTRESHFYDQELKEQAFFNYFLVEDSHIAARGRGGGLALWIRVRTATRD
ncbi:MAG: hypothetical protein ACFE0I_14055 [Elainellaceae cyanobacterium]